MSSALCDSVIQPFGCVFNIFVAVKCALSAVPCERMACAVFHFGFCVCFDDDDDFGCVCVFSVSFFFIHRFCAVLLSMMRIDGLSGHLSHCNRNIIKQMKLHKADKMLCPLLHFTQFSLWSNRKDETNVRVRARDRSSLYMHILCCFARKMCWHFWRTKNPDSTIKLTRFSTK